MTPGLRRSHELTALAAITAVAILGFLATQPPVYNPAGSIDPWLYTALFVDFQPTYDAFGQTYYAARLPLIIPGVALNAVLDPQAAYYVLHGGFFLAGALFLFLLVRAHFGQIAGLATYAWVAGSQMYFAAHRWDYWDGTIITYLAAGLYFTLTRPAQPTLVLIYRVLGGFFFAAGVATNPYVSVLILPLPVLYAAICLQRPFGPVIRHTAIDLIAWVAGASMLFVGCGLFALASGGPFWFIEPQLRAAREIDESDFKLPYGDWLPFEPRVIVPLFLVALLGILTCFYDTRWAPERRAALGAWLYLGSLSALLALHEFAFGGYFLEYLYYFNLLLPAMALCFGAVCHYIARGTSVGLAVVSLIAVVVGVEAAQFLVYATDDVDLIGKIAYTAIVPMAVGAAALLVRRALAAERSLVSVAVLVSAFSLAGGTAYAFDGSRGTFAQSDSASREISADTFAVSMEIFPFLQDELSSPTTTGFWYDSTASEAHTAIQSLYYYEYTYVGLDLPEVNADFRKRLGRIDPETIVLLCLRSSCEGAPDRLADAGIPATLRVERSFAHGGLRVWVRVYDLVPQNFP